MAQQTANAAPLTVVLVHGAYADASSWNGVVERLQAAGLQVMAPANPLRGISIDSAYTASFLKQIPGPVLAVGHSYGGAVISNAATGAPNVCEIRDCPTDKTIHAASKLAVAYWQAPRRERAAGPNTDWPKASK